MSDIYVKGWMTGKEDDVQKTDVHYRFVSLFARSIRFFFNENNRSMDGEGNFNWRFVYGFAYFPAEQCISVKKKEHFWSYETTEFVIPPILNLQIWDNDKFTPDDFLGECTCLFSVSSPTKLPSVGALTLDLNHLCKPAKDAETCSLNVFSEDSSNLVSLFQMKRLKGWWPCIDLQDGHPTLTVRPWTNIDLAD